jgi:hypothetical protein
VAEIGVAGAGGNDQVVIGNLDIRQLDHPARQIEILHLAQQNFHILPTNNPANGGGDFPRREAGRCHLVKQRLKRVVVLAVDQRHLHGFMGQLPRGQQSAKTAAYNDHPGYVLAVHSSTL